MAYIEYLYLTSTAIGLVLVTIHYSEQRDIYYLRYNELYFQQIERQHKEQLIPPLRAYILATCVQGEGIPLLTIHCRFARELENLTRDILPTENAVQRLRNVEETFTAVWEAEEKRISDAFDILRALEGQTDVPQELKDRLDRLRHGTDLGTFEIVSTHFKIVAQDIRARAAETQKYRPQHALFATIISIGYMVIWPYFFAFALALRLTKVTVDLTGWARGPAAK